MWSLDPCFNYVHDASFKKKENTALLLFESCFCLLHMLSHMLISPTCW